VEKCSNERERKNERDLGIPGNNGKMEKHGDLIARLCVPRARSGSANSDDLADAAASQDAYRRTSENFSSRHEVPSSRLLSSRGFKKFRRVPTSDLRNFRRSDRAVQV